MNHKVRQEWHGTSGALCQPMTRCYIHRSMNPGHAENKQSLSVLVRERQGLA